MTQTCDVAVVGGGLAGSSFAARLARQGKQVLLLERSPGPHHKVCGDFLSHEALWYLRQLGVDIDALGAVRLSRVRLYGEGRFTAECALPFPACSLTRWQLDEALLHCASASGACVRRGVHVQNVQRDHDIWTVSTRENEAIAAPVLVLASGKHDLHGHPRPAGRHAGLVGFKMYYTLAPAQHALLGDTVEIVTFRGGYAGLQPIEHGRANLCALVEADLLTRLGGGWRGLDAYLRERLPVLAERLSGATPMLSAPLTVARIPYGFVQHRSSDGLWRIGDQAAVIPSFSGDGMSIALHSAALAAGCFVDGRSADRFQRELAQQLRMPMRLATMLSLLLVKHPGLTTIAQVWPSLLGHLGSMTRIPRRNLRASYGGAHVHSLYGVADGGDGKVF